MATRQKGLQQVDPLAPFSFLLVMEGLEGLVNKAKEIGLLTGFKVNQNIHMSLLQFADDTILIYDELNENLWGLKAILRGFEFVSGLKIIFAKSKVIRINLLELMFGVCCNNLTKKMMKMNMMKRAHKFQRLLYILIVRKMLLHLKPEKFNGYACKTQSAWGCHTNL